jgi:1-deoxy-D-xylulose-5-phosphate synthase
VPQQFLEHGSRSEVLAQVGLTAQDVARRVTEWVAGRIGEAAPAQAVGSHEVPAEERKHG